MNSAFDPAAGPSAATVADAGLEAGCDEAVESDVDTGTIGWLLPEIDHAFDAAIAALRQFRAGAAGVERADVDLAPLRMARSHLHQAHGALELGELAGVTKLTEAIEAFLADFENDPARCDATALDAIIGGCRSILEYLEDLQNGARQQPLYLFPSYRDLLVARGADRIHPADLFTADLSVRAPRDDGGKALGTEELKSQRSGFEQALLRYIRDENDAVALAKLARSVAAIDGSVGASATAGQSQRAFWWVARAFFDALAHGGFVGASGQQEHMKRLAGRVNLQIRKLVEGSGAVTERLLADMLFFLAIALPVTQRVRDAQARFRLADAVPVDFETQRYGRFDPQALKAARDALSNAKTSWSAVAAGDADQIREFARHTSALLDATGPLRRSGLAQLAQVVDSIATDLGFDPRKPAAAVGLDVATALLFLEGALEHARRLDDAFDERAAMVVARIEASVLGQSTSTKVDWLDRMSREAQERLTVATFVAELQANLRSAEKELDTFFRDPADRGGLAEAQRALAQVSGALALLGHDDVHRAIDHARTTIARFEQEDRVDQAAFENLAQSIGAVGFYVDQLKRDRIDPAAFHFDAASGRFEIEMAKPSARPASRDDVPLPATNEAATAEKPAEPDFTYSNIAFAETQLLESEASLEDEIARRASDAGQHALLLREDPDDHALRAQLAAAIDDVRRNAALIDDRALQDEAADVLAAVRRTGSETLAAAAAAELADSVAMLLAHAHHAVGIEAPAALPAEPEVAVPAADAHAAIDAELLEIFLEEAGEVTVDAAASLRVLDADPSNATAIVNLRRGFHTLKGSGRMVGLMAFGDAGWAIEDTLNAHIADQAPASNDLRALIDYAIRFLSAWIEELRATGRSSRDPDTLIEAARAVRAGAAPGEMVVAPAAVAAAPDASLESPAAPAVHGAEPAADDFSRTALFATDEPAADDFSRTALFATDEHTPDEHTADQDATDRDVDDAGHGAFATTQVLPDEPEGGEVAFFGEQPSHPPIEAAATPPGTVAPSVPGDPLEFAAFEPLFAIDPPRSTVVPSAGATDDAASDAASTADGDLPARGAVDDEPAGIDAEDFVASPPADSESIDADLPTFDWLDAKASTGPAAVPVEQRDAEASASIESDPAPTEAPVGRVAADEGADAADRPDHADAAAQPVSNVVAFTMRDAVAASEDVRQIGPLTLSVALFNIYLTEADELLRVLTLDFSEWRYELDRFVSESSMRAAHSLAGSSATVGLVPAHDLAAGIEGVLQALYREPTVLRVDQVDCLQEAVEALRKMLHRFAAERWPEPDSVRVAALIALRREIAASDSIVMVPIEPPVEEAPPVSFDVDDDFAWEPATPAGTSEPVASATTNEAIEEVRETFAVAGGTSVDRPSSLVGPSPDALEGSVENAVEDASEDALRASLDASPRDPLGARHDDALVESLDEAPAEPLAAPGAESLESLEPLEPLEPLESLESLEPLESLDASASVGASEVAIDHAAAVEVEERDAAWPFVVPRDDEPVSENALQPVDGAPRAAEHAVDEAPEAVVGAVADAVADAVVDAVAEAVVPADEPALADLPDATRAAQAAVDAGPDASAVPPVEAVAASEPQHVHPQSFAASSLPAADLDALAQTQRATPRERESVVKDDIDPDLLGVFVEEGGEILPQIGTLLRTWQAHPANPAPSRLLLRHLHTLKGSARMAGAMRLGEVVHDIETRVESAARLQDVPMPLIDELLAAHDRSLELFDQLQNPDAALQEAARPSEAAAEPAMGLADEVGANDAVQTASVVPSAAAPGAARAGKQASQAAVRVQSDTLDRLVNLAGEVSISRARIENEVLQSKGAMADLSENVERLRAQLREIELQAEFQMQSKMQSQQGSGAERDKFDPLEFDRFTRFQELTRMMAESVNDVKTVQQNLQKSLDTAEADLTSQRRMTRDLQQDLMSIRMVPFSSIAERLYRVARRTAKELDKRVNLDIRGGSVEIDRSVLERMAGPFEHLLRNHIVHGIEARATRRDQGKSETGELLVEARQEGNEIVLMFSDDGAGLDHDRLRAKGRALGLLGDGDVSDAQAAELIFHPGLTTVSEVTELAGRGVGMEVVRAEAMELAGRVSVDSTAGRGTRFTINLPVTLAVTQVVLVRVAHRTYALPAVLVEQVQQLRPQPLTDAYRAGSLDFAGAAVAIAFLGTLLGVDDSVPVAQRASPVLILRSGGERLAIHVDEVVGNQEVVVKNLGPQLARMTGVAGATVLGSGEIVLILNPVQLAQMVRSEKARDVRPVLPDDAAAETPPAGAALLTLPTVMVVDDSLTVRRVTQRLLSREGYQVVLAKDGVDALEQLQDYPPDIMLVDIEMPRMDGFDLTRNVRNDDRYRHIPIIMITSRTAEKHRRHAAELGVDAYLGKPYQEDELLELMARHARAPRKAHPA